MDTGGMEIGPINAVYNSIYHIPGTVPGTGDTVLIITEAGFLEFTLKTWRLCFYPHELHCSLLER